MHKRCASCRGPPARPSPACFNCCPPARCLCADRPVPTTPSPSTHSDLSGNELRGRLPGRWARLDSLERLRLDANALTGPLPAGWNTMEAIQHL